MNNESTIWQFLKSKGFTDIAAAAITGNLYAESGLEPKNLQTVYEATLGMTDDQYTQAVDSGSYGNFVRDLAGYGLAQWTFWSRKQALLNKAKSMGKSIGDLNMQLSYLWDELQKFGLVGKLNACGSVRDASNLMLFEFEKPYDTGMSVQNARTNWSQGFYDRNHNAVMPVVPEMPAADQIRYCVMAKQEIADLNKAKELMTVLKGYGFEGMIINVIV